MRRHEPYGGSRIHLRSCHRPLSYTGHHLLPSWPPQSCLSLAHFPASKPLAQADAGEFTQTKTSKVPTHSIDTVSYKQRARVNFLEPPASTSHLTEDPMPALPISPRRATCRLRRRMPVNSRKIKPAESPHIAIGTVRYK